MLKQEPAKTPEPRQRKEEEEYEQQHEHLLGHNDAHGLKSGEERALVVLEGRRRRGKRDSQAHGREVRFIHHRQSLYPRAVLPLEMVEKSVTLCKDTSGWCFRHEAVPRGHLSLE
jgi:hypothetical protein